MSTMAVRRRWVRTVAAATAFLVGACSSNADPAPLVVGDPDAPLVSMPVYQPPTSAPQASAPIAVAVAAEPAPAPSPVAPECGNSFDPACGDFYWDPPLPPNQPIELSVTFDPPQPIAGQPVTITTQLVDPEGLFGQLGHTFEGCRPLGTPDDCVAGLALSRLDCAEVFGPWSPPALPPEPLRMSRTLSVVFDAPGTFKFELLAVTIGPEHIADNGWTLCGPARAPYHDRAQQPGTITVLPAPPADPGGTQ